MSKKKHTYKFTILSSDFNDIDEYYAYEEEAIRRRFQKKIYKNAKSEAMYKHIYNSINQGFYRRWSDVPEKEQKYMLKNLLVDKYKNKHAVYYEFYNCGEGIGKRGKKHPRKKSEFYPTYD